MTARMVRSAFLTFFSCMSVCSATDWTEFRGPQGQGHSDSVNLPRNWSETENITWKVKTEGIGWSSPVVANDRIYLTTSVPLNTDEQSPQSLRTICIAAGDGSVIWDIEVFQNNGEGVEIHSKNSHASPTPVIDGDRVFVHFGPHGTACLKLDGSIVWENNELKYEPQHGNGGCPAVAGNVLVICCDGKDQRYVAGLNKQTGRQIWRTERKLTPSRGFSFCTPTILDVNGQLQAICPGSGGVWSYATDTGEQLWQVSYGEGYSVVPRPVIANGLVYVCSGFGDSQLFAIDPSGSGDISETHVKWKTKKGVPKSPSVLCVRDELYMVDDRGVASCLNAHTGEMHWQRRLSGAFSASPVFADGVIYFQNETGETTVVAPGTTYKEVAINQIGDGESRTFASFAFVDGAILLRSETHLYRIEKR